MASVIARHAFATLALSAKLHRMLAQIEHRRTHPRQHEVAAFDEEMEATLASLEERPFAKELRVHELSMLKNEFSELERLYDGIRERRRLPESATQRFDRIFAGLREKLQEKEFAL